MKRLRISTVFGACVKETTETWIVKTAKFCNHPEERKERSSGANRNLQLGITGYDGPPWTLGVF
jgi:hypothetical protein